MRALSLTQPWATAIALGIKHWETRSWSTSYRGRSLHSRVEEISRMGERLRGRNGLESRFPADWLHRVRV